MHSINQISYKELVNWQAEKKDFLLIDVREPSEHQAHNIGGQLIPFADFIKAAKDLPSDKPVIIYCQKGIRSTILIQRLAGRRDCSNFYNLTNGIQFLST